MPLKGADRGLCELALQNNVTRLLLATKDSLAKYSPV